MAYSSPRSPDAPSEPRVDVPPEPAGPLEPSYHERFEQAKALLLELLGHLKRLVAIRIDKVTLSVRKAILWAALTIGAGIITLAAIIYSVVLVMSGMAQGLGVLFGNRPWLGELTVGVAALGGLWLFSYVALSRMTHAARQRIHDKYDALAAARPPKPAASVPPEQTHV